MIKVFQKVPLKKRVIALGKLFLWFVLFDLVLGPAGYLQQERRFHTKPFGLGIVTFTGLIIITSYLVTILLTIWARWALDREVHQTIIGRFFLQSLTMYAAGGIAALALVCMAFIPQNHSFASLAAYQQLAIIVFWVALV